MDFHIPASERTALKGGHNNQNGASGHFSFDDNLNPEAEKKAGVLKWLIVRGSVICVLCVITLLFFGVKTIWRGHDDPQQLATATSSESESGSYRLSERHEGANFFDHYIFYEGNDSVGSGGFNTYVNQETAFQLGIVNITHNQENTRQQKESFVYMASTPTEEGPRQAVRLEGKRRFDHGLFIVDLRHMPAGCGVWPAFWLTDEANWPDHGEIDIVEGVNYQSVAKTALHTTEGCNMDAVVVEQVMTGAWDTAIGIPDKDDGIPDMTLRNATDCFVYDEHQWLNQGCVAMSNDQESLGEPLNKRGGGVFVLEWDPDNKHIRSWVFSPHTNVPDNLEEAISTASNSNPRKHVTPDPNSWPLPYGYFSIGKFCL
mmetsp:Transcript_1893/g.2555  ORF Transcript_1893/g.2555 Transcript_1893/m.2555 type:complete len:373 (+) Transcript_1893:84-1202(+)